MKKILIVNNNMHIGGIQKALVNLLKEIKDKYDVTLFLFNNNGLLKDEIPKGVKVICANKFTRILAMSHAEAKEAGFFTFLHRSFWTIVTRIFKTRVSFAVISRMQKIKENYDASISYMQNESNSIFYGGCAEFVLNSTKSTNKICFIHCDFLNYPGNNKYNKATLKKFDKIAAVSESVAKRLAYAVPDIADKIHTVYNCNDFESMNRLKDEYEPKLNCDKINLFTAARLHREKGILRMIPILKRIKDSGVDFLWNIAGDGPDKEEAVRLINAYGLRNNIVLLGNLKNPYPYFYKSDIVLVPSYEEAAPMVFSEAIYFGTQIFTTDTTSAKEMVSDAGFGVVCKNSDLEIENTLFDFMKNYTRQKKAPPLCNNDAALLGFEKAVGGK